MAVALKTEQWLEAENKFTVPPTRSYVSLTEQCTYFKTDNNETLTRCKTKNQLCGLEPHSQQCMLMKSGVTTQTLLYALVVGLSLVAAAAVAEFVVCRSLRGGFRITVRIGFALLAAAAVASVVQWDIFAKRYNDESPLLQWHFGRGFVLHVAGSAAATVALFSDFFIGTRPRKPRPSAYTSIN